VRTPLQAAKRPIVVTVIALFQAALAAYFIYCVSIALLNPPDNLGFLRSAVRLPIGRTDRFSYVRRPHEEIALDLFCLVAAALAIAAYSAITGWGLWRLKKWARHSVAGVYGITVVLWARALLYFGIFGGFHRVSASELQPLYIVIVIEAIICMTLLFHLGVAEAFGGVD
jgi:hypothetical protein